MAPDNGVGYRLFVKGKLVLAQDCDPLPGTDRNSTLVRLDLAGEYLQEGGFACAVGADLSVAIPRGEFYVDVLEDNPLAI